MMTRHPTLLAATIALIPVLLLSGCGHSSSSAASGGSATTSTISIVGRVVDGYIANATVTLDVNDDRICGDTQRDSKGNAIADVSTTADASGNYSLPSPDGKTHMLCVTGGVDRATGLPLVGQLLAPPGATIISPLSSLIMTQLNALDPTTHLPVPLTPASIQAATAQLANRLGLAGVTDANGNPIDLLNTDPVALAQGSGLGGKPALLQTNEAVQALLVQSASITQRVGSATTTQAGDANAISLYQDAMLALNASLANLTVPATTNANNGQVPQLDALACFAIQQTVLNASRDTRPVGLDLSQVTPAAVASLTCPSVGKAIDLVAGAGANQLLQPGAKNPAATVQANVAIANTAGLLASLLGGGTNLQTLATLASQILPAPASNGAITPPATASVIQAALSAAGVSDPTLLASLTTALQNSSGISNATQIVEADLNCDLSNGTPSSACGTLATQAFNAGNPLTQATATLPVGTAWHNVILRLGQPNGLAIGTSTDTLVNSALTIDVVPTLTAADARRLTITVPLSGTQHGDGSFIGTLSGDMKVTGHNHAATAAGGAFSNSLLIARADAAQIVRLGSDGFSLTLDLDQLVNRLKALQWGDLFNLTGGAYNRSLTITFSTPANNGLRLTTYPSPTPTVTNTFTMQVAWINPGTFLYVLNRTSNSLSAFAVDSTGSLTPVAGSPYATGNLPTALTTSPDGHFVYVTNKEDGVGAGSISEYAVNQSTGALTALAGSPFATGTNPDAIAITPNNKFAVVTTAGDNSVRSYAVQTNGQLTSFPLAVRAGSLPTAVAISSDNQYAYVTSSGDNSLRTYAINSFNGQLTALDASTLTIAGGPAALTLAPKSLFVTGQDGSIATVSLTAPAKPSTSGQQATLLGAGMTGLVLGKSGTSAYATNTASGQLLGLTLNSSGVLTLASTRNAAGSLPSALVLDPSGTFAYVSNADRGTVSAYQIGANGALAPLSGLAGNEFASGTNPGPLATVVTK